MKSTPSAEVPAGRYLRLPNGLRIWFQETGEGPVVVLLHGGTRTSQGLANRFTPVLAPRFRVIAVDSRGHGHSVNTTDRLTYRMMADDVAQLMNELVIDKACFYGFSDGANVALDLAVRQPERVRALALAGVIFKGYDGYLAAIHDFFGGEVVTDAGLDRLARDHPDFVADLVTLHAPQGEDHWRHLLPVIWRLFIDPFDGRNGYDLEELRRVVAPTLFLIGDHDQLIPVEHTVELFRSLPAARLRVEPGYGHGTHPSWPQLVADFFAEHALPPTGVPPA